MGRRRLDPAFTAAWAVWWLAFAIIEGLAIWRRRAGDGRGRTLTSHIWAVRELRYGKVRLGLILLAPLWVWLTLHIFLEV